MHTPVPGLAAVVIAAVLVGCGGSTSTTYDRTYTTPVQTTASAATSHPAPGTFAARLAAEEVRIGSLTSDINQAFATAQQTSRGTVAQEMADLARRASAEGAALGALKPPPSLSSQLMSDANGFHTVGAILRRLARAVTAGDVPAQRAASQELVSTATTVKAVNVALRTAAGLPPS